MGRSLKDRLLKRATRWAISADPATSVRRLASVKKYWALPTEIALSDTVFSVSEGEARLFTARASRIPNLMGGIERRLNTLRAEYLIDDGMIRPGDVVVDCGANIGEVSVICAGQGAQVLAFEPDPIEFTALQKNAEAAGFEAFNLALWHSPGEMTFYDANESGDSSLIKPATYDREIRVATIALDQFEALPEGRIRLIKLEAEGAEPEIIRGMAETLGRTDYVTVDMGAERGMSKDNTVAEVTDALYRLEFGLKRFSHVRMVGLFEARPGDGSTQT